jgi:hypothetical protein
VLIFRGVYLPRTILASTVQICQSIQYFGVGWYLPVISASLFGKNFVYATLGSLFFNIFGIVGGFLSPSIGRRLGLRRSSAIGFAIAFLVLLTLGLFSDRMPLWASLMVPALFILFHSGGPGANGKSLSLSPFAANYAPAPTASSVRWGRLAPPSVCLSSPSFVKCTDYSRPF